MELQEIKGRFRVLFPKANLSNVRLEQYATRLQQKLNEESTEEDVDNLIKDLNDIIDFEQIAKDDDRARTYKKPEKDPEPKESDSTLELLKKLNEKIDKLEADKYRESISSKFKKDERLANIPEVIVNKFIPDSFDDIESTIETLVGTFKDEQVRSKLGSFGIDTPPQGEQSFQKKVKTIEDLKKENIKV